jgi:hypothetical protein
MVGMRLATLAGHMRSVFAAGPNMVRSEIVAVEPEGPYRLTIDHGQGTIVEYFATSGAALLRQAELEELLMSARGAGAAETVSV